MPPMIPLIDLFAGCGGMTRGFVDSGRFEPVLAVEWDPDAAATYGENFGSNHVIAGDIAAVERFPSADVVIGGPPCQGFSPLNMTGAGLERRALWREYLRVLDDAQPLAFVMENVPQLLKSGEYAVFTREVERRGFEVRADVLNAADYGVPQTRKRAIVVGSRVGAPILPRPTHHAPGRLGEGDEWRTFRWAVENPTKLPLTPSGLAWHCGRNPRPLSMERYRTIPEEGEGRFELAARRPDITPPCWIRKKTGSTDVFGRLWWDRPAFTIRTEFYKPEKGRYLHPSEDRPITVREAARCMSFPDDFILPTDQSMTSIARQVGNAVPPLLAQRIAEALTDLLVRRGDLEVSAA